MSTPTGPPKSSAIRIPDGIYVPTPAFFLPDESLDLASLSTHIDHLLTSGVHGIVVHGSNGEAVHLSPSERISMLALARKTILAHPRSASPSPAIPLVAGCGAHSTREVLQLTRDAATAGATHALVLPPSYYNPLVSDAALIAHFRAVADQSPLPIIIYNYPGASSGRDMSSDVIGELAQHPNILGVKLTCGNTGKLARVAAVAPEGFFTAGGSADFILQGAVVGGNGSICGLANVCPRACVELFDKGAKGDFAGAKELQAKVARADWAVIQTGFVGVKAQVAALSGGKIGATVRKPCEELREGEVQVLGERFVEIIKVEKALKK